MHMPFREKPVVVRAVRWDRTNLQEVANLGGASEYEQDFLGEELVVRTLEGEMTAHKGDWVIKGVNGETLSLQARYIRDDL
jgi:hypothetical protein